MLPSILGGNLTIQTGTREREGEEASNVGTRERKDDSLEVGGVDGLLATCPSQTLCLSGAEAIRMKGAFVDVFALE